MLLSPDRNDLLTENVRIPKVSIGMPVYNGEPFISKALDSLLAQTFTDFELIISDNASTDSTEAICREYAARDTRIRYVRQSENKGATKNFQFVLDEAQGQYFMWAAADDMWNKVCLMQWVLLLDRDDSIVLVFSHFYLFCHNNQRLMPNYVESTVGNTITNRLLMRMLNPISNLIYGMFRRNVSRDVKVQEFDYFDVYFGYVMATKGKIVIHQDFLFYAGVRGDYREPYSLTGGKISVLRFLIHTMRLINKSISWPHRVLFYILLTRQVFLMHRQTRIAAKLLPSAWRPISS
jgi:glycosyltransferase involved in cell wall biosynthesis